MKPTVFTKTLLTATGLRIFLMLAFSMIFAAIVINFIFFELQDRRLESQVVQEGQSLAKLFASNVQLAVFSNSQELLQLPVRSLLLYPDILAVAIYDNAGKLILAREITQSGAWGEARAEDFGKVHGSSSSMGKEGNTIIFQEPVRIRVSTAPVEDLFFENTANKQSRDIGSVRIKVSARRLVEGRKDFIVQSCIVSLAFLAIILPLTFYIVRVSTRPLTHLLLRVKQQMGAQKSQTSDIALLDNTFTALLKELEQSFQTINSLRENLEQQVERRTAALETTNSHLQKTIEELRATQNQLVHSEKMASLGLLATGLAHEINNALTLIGGSLFPLEKIARQLVGDGQQQPAEVKVKLEHSLAELVQYINTGVQRITLLIKDLMTFARPGKGTRHLVDLHQELEMTLRLLNIEARDQLDVEIRKEFNPIPSISCHGSQISQVFLNILINAVQAIQQKGYIRIATGMEGDRVCVTIEDNGSGIAPEILPKIFDPFFTTKDVGSGTGLGLGICYAIIREHGGEIRVTSQLGQGTKFFILLPIAKSSDDMCKNTSVVQEHREQISA